MSCQANSSGESAPWPAFQLEVQLVGQHAFLFQLQAGQHASAGRGKAAADHEEVSGLLQAKYATCSGVAYASADLDDQGFLKHEMPTQVNQSIWSRDEDEILK